MSANRLTSLSLDRRKSWNRAPLFFSDHGRKSVWPTICKARAMETGEKCCASFFFQGIAKRGVVTPTGCWRLSLASQFATQQMCLFNWLSGVLPQWWLSGVEENDLWVKHYVGYKTWEIFTLLFTGHGQEKYRPDLEIEDITQSPVWHKSSGLTYRELKRFAGEGEREWKHLSSLSSHCKGRLA